MGSAVSGAVDTPPAGRLGGGHSSPHSSEKSFHSARYCSRFSILSLSSRKKARSFRKYLYNIPDIHDGAGPAGLTMILQGHTAQV